MFIDHPTLIGEIVRHLCFVVQSITFGRASTPFPAGSPLIAPPSPMAVVPSTMVSIASPVSSAIPTMPAIEVTPAMLNGYRNPEPDAQDGLLATYLAELDRAQPPIPQNTRIHCLDYMMARFHCLDTHFDLAACLKGSGFAPTRHVPAPDDVQSKDHTKDVVALSNSLRFVFKV